MTRLKAIRAGHKSVVSRTISHFQEITENRSTHENSTTSDTEFQDQLEDILNTLTKKNDVLRELNAKILEEIKEEEIEEEIVIEDRYVSYLETNIRKVRKCINLISPIPSESSQQNSENNHQMLNPTAQEFISKSVNSLPPVHQPSDFMNSGISMTNSYHKLPKLSLPSFHGDILEWQSFWDSYEAAIHSNFSLSDVQKFNYLRSLLRDDAAHMIAGFALTNANYEKAITLLLDRYGQQHKISQTYMQALIDVPAPSYSLRSLRNFYDKTESYVRGLESLGQKQDSYGNLLVPIIINKLPKEIRMNLAREHGSTSWNLDELRHCILREINVLDAGNIVDKIERELSPPPTAAFFTRSTKPRVYAKHQQSAKENITSRPCVFCKQIHSPNECTQVTSIAKRLEIVKKLNLCFNCLGHHRLAECKSPKSCKKCKNRHHTSICNAKTEKDEAPTKNESKSDIRVTTAIESKSEPTEVKHVATMHSSSTKPDVLLQTTIVKVSSRNNARNANILFDGGAQRSFIDKKLADRLDLELTGTESLCISGFGESNKKIRHLDRAVVNIHTENNKKIPIEVLIVPKIADPIQMNIAEISHLKHIKGLRLAMPIDYSETFETEILIGADHYWDFVQNEVIHGEKRSPTAVKSSLGYLLSGPTGNRGIMPEISMMNILTDHKMEEYNLEKFWNLESLGIKDPQIENDQSSEKYKDKCIIFHGNKYTAKLPWKDNHPELPTNESITRKRTQNVINRLTQEPDMLKIYGDIITEQERRNFIERVTDDIDKDSGKQIHYIPHHPVKKDSATTPIRIVYDCSCRENKDSPCLNDCLSSTPPDLNDITGILARFRLEKYAVTADIEKAFLHVGLHEDDRDVTRFFWLSDPSNPNSKWVTYRFKSVLFGATCSPFILNATLLKHLDGHNTDVSENIKRDLYVDNILSSLATEQNALDYFLEARTVMTEAQFNLRSWTSNSEKLREIAQLHGVLDTDTETKILGMRWNTSSDTIMYSNKEIRNNQVVTKREILKSSAAIHDPMGFIGPVTIRSKILMQELWKGKFEWDEKVPHEIEEKWNEINEDIRKATTEFQVGRHYFDGCNEERKLSLHVFVDASQSAYGACVYITNGTQTKLVIAKNRVAPVKGLTLPRLELMAAVIGARLGKKIMDELNISETTFWSDSQIVLHWLKSNKTLNKFVNNRKNEIISLTSENEWRYVPTKDNPADLQTRGISATELLESELWLNGPKWLTRNDMWPSWTCSDTAVLFNSSDNSECNVSTPPTEPDAYGIQHVFDIAKATNLDKVLRITCYVLRFIRNCKTKRCYNLRNRRMITSMSSVETPNHNELETASTKWILDCQNSVFKEHLETLRTKQTKQTALVKQLKLFIDDKGIIRCGGRIDNAQLDYSTKYPILLPKHHALSDLIIQDAHRKTLHAGPSHTVTFVRQRYWIPAIRQCVNRNLRKCVQCQRITSTAYPRPDPPPLPADRVSETTPFSVTGVDYAGPLHVKGTNGSKKVYICLFTCATYRAIHLELVPDLSTESFMLAFRRFTSAQSTPSTIYSDNATTFTSAAKELKDGGTSISWKFIPKAAPWYGGWWERLIGLTKKTLKKVLGKSLINEDTLKTILKEIEVVLNDRPLTYISSSIEDPEPLTPAHLLYGRKKTLNQSTEPQNVAVMHHDHLNKILCRKKLLLEHFTNRWKMEYLTNLRESHRISGKNKQSIEVGDIVLVHDEGPRVNWKLAKVIQLIPGKDSLIRAANIRTKNGITNRPITKLYPLEINANRKD